MRHARPTLLLNGFMGSGKSTVGRLVAERAGALFVDLDEAITVRAGKPVDAIFRDLGEPAFRALEAELLAETLAAAAGEGAEPDRPSVVAVGGGALVHRERRREALNRACVVTLTAAPDTLVARTAGSTRPLLARAEDPVARVRELLEARAEAYLEAHAHVSTDERSPEQVAAAVLAAWSQRSIAVPLGVRSYVVHFTAGAAEMAAEAVARLAPTGVFVVTDENVAPRWGGPLADALAARGLAPRVTVELTPGEQHKRLGPIEKALAAMVEAGADRGAVVVGHGGGVVTDMAGFAAATLLRGVRWVALPTTLLSMVDASVGGKTGVDLGPAKNAVGAFHQPSAVVIDVAQVKTETDRNYRSGLAEVVKAACIADPELFTLLEGSSAAVLAREPSVVEELAFRAIAVKATIVARDEHENGDRALLNFGHTVGHALEAEGGFHRLTHGEAVSLGMVAMLRVGQALGVTPVAEAERVVRLLAQLELPVDLDAQPLAAALRFISLDKKRRGSAVRAVVMERVGATRVHPLAIDAFSALLGVTPA
jgi:shikimate kinase / 3-dehydroquinate synthase